MELKRTRTLYIDLLKAAVRNTLYRRDVKPPEPEDLTECRKILQRLHLKFGPFMANSYLDETGIYYIMKGNSPDAHTLGNPEQLDNVQHCVEYVLQHDIPGDFIETGVFRGGQTIFMRGLLKAYNITDRKVFVADSFEGLPPPDPSMNLDDAIAHEILNGVNHFKVSCADVKVNFSRYGLLDEQVHFLEGWFSDTLPAAPIGQLAVARLDGDYYDSTKDAIEILYPKLSVGGFLIIDDYGFPIGCRRAINEYREKHKISDPLIPVDYQTYYWHKTQP